MLVVSWQLSYYIFCIKRVLLKPFGTTYLDIYIPNRLEKFRNAAFVRHFKLLYFDATA